MTTGLQRVIVLWLDGTFAEKYAQTMPSDFNTQITASSETADPTYAAASVEVRNDLVTNGTVVIPISTISEAKERIRAEQDLDVKIFFISSGSLGQQIIPNMIKSSDHRYSFYIFCFDMALHSPWATEYVETLQMFIHPIDLLVRLMRDISIYFINQGSSYLKIPDGNTALRYFRHAKNLEDRANIRDKSKPNPKHPNPMCPQPDFRKHLDLLEGPNGLISRASQIADH